ncbi:MAG: hypothetical protein GY821_08180 [Gammaproteobacteria bacterium]|nr:hypothetical protein [Gammaproteobacteria bacterium]MCP4474524.1 hypothetical protein [Gammaproteobacteria bacterium]
MRKRINLYCFLTIAIFLSPLSLSYAQNSDDFARVFPHVSHCSDLTGIWTGQAIEYDYHVDARGSNDHGVKIVFVEKKGKTIGRVINKGTSPIVVFTIVSGQMWANCHNGVLTNIRFPIEKLDLARMPKYGDHIRAPIAYGNGVLIDGNHLIMNVQTCDNMGGSDSGLLILTKMSDYYPDTAPIKSTSYIFPTSYSPGYPVEPDGCYNGEYPKSL